MDLETPVTGDGTVSDVEQLYIEERDHLVAELRALDSDQWATASLCTGWSVRDLTAHLLMPYELSVPGLLRRIVPARFDFDRLADRWARADRRTGPQLAVALGATTAAGFAVPGAGDLAPLSHLVIHAQDVRHPLGLRARCGSGAAVRVLDDITLGKHSVGERILGGLRVIATDVEWALGDSGPTVKGPSAVLINALNGRDSSAAALAGDGVGELRRRFAD
jgi:uncharacterized protein (TIGR03083 family)